MLKVLSDAAVEQYHRDGYYFPVKALDPAQAAESRARLEAFEAGQGESISGAQRSKSHLLFRWVDDLMRSRPSSMPWRI